MPSKGSSCMRMAVKDALGAMPLWVADGRSSPLPLTLTDLVDPPETRAFAERTRAEGWADTAVKYWLLTLWWMVWAPASTGG